ncbi:MAG TPA: Wzz/FepE/Etk N-terminal domain-containing protein [Tenuifilaceae bacterium]|nr:Wzz/FepE/Etk N-terminal domain-containing protein [Tenuifilaceae bacterium]HOZ15898.1 Wzz/FepE/Etk N-terminal domain-containing protein [Tenuifilaceae bacterium]HPI44265.1 Wzz/FepE/Etk N-terminal domain-containing protein [Tenuifilaceae bacterium]HPN20823.1 Wzz/FepE/Etk N-terminal domain-containing protein [Tenuifilaceae bacterium]
MTTENKNFDLNTSDIINALWNFRKILILITFLAFIASTIAAFLIEPKFKSTSIIYPPVANQASKELFTLMKQEGLTVFGETEEAEQFLQILTSRTLKDSVINKLNLMNNYGIQPNEKHAKFKIYQRYDDNVRVKPTQYQSVMIEVTDRNPDMAAKIANTVVDLCDSAMRSVKTQIAQKALLALEAQYEQGLAEMKTLEDSLTKVMMNGVVDLKMQSEQYYKDYTKALIANDKRAISVLEKQIKPLQEYGSQYRRYKDEIKEMALHLTEMRQGLKVVRIEAQQTIPSQFVIDRAVAADKKAYPKRSLVIILSTLASVFFTVFAIVLMEFIKGFKQNK